MIFTAQQDQLVWEDLDVDDDHRLSQNFGNELIFTLVLLFKKIIFNVKQVANPARVFPPGTVYAVYIEEDSVFCGGHFLTLPIMNGPSQVLGRTELDPSRTNDSKGVDLFQILKPFILDTLSSSSPDSTKSQFHGFVRPFESYILLTPPTDVKDREETAHFKKGRFSWLRMMKMDG